MKITQATEEFRPVTITLDYEGELDAMVEAVAHVTGNLNPDVDLGLAEELCKKLYSILVDM
jgi:hypothetical protein